MVQGSEVFSLQIKVLKATQNIIIIFVKRFNNNLSSMKHCRYGVKIYTINQSIYGKILFRDCTIKYVLSTKKWVSLKKNHIMDRNTAASLQR